MPLHVQCHKHNAIATQHNTIATQHNTIATQHTIPTDDWMPHGYHL